MGSNRSLADGWEFAVSVISEQIPHYPDLEPKNFIDKFVFAKLRQFNIIPSELSSDAEFLRRVCLDLTGTLAPPERTRAFLASKDPQKREKLIETLLNTPEYEDRDEILSLAPGIDLWCGGVLIPAPFVYPERSGAWGCGIVLANMTRKEAETCARLGKALERISADDFLTDNEPSHLSFAVI